LHIIRDSSTLTPPLIEEFTPEASGKPLDSTADESFDGDKSRVLPYGFFDATVLTRSVPESAWSESL
jgi:hypothetical protein